MDMKNYVAPTVVEFGNSKDLIQGCSGGGLEGFTFNSRNNQNRVVRINGVLRCVCTNLSGLLC